VNSLRGLALTPQGWRRGELQFKDGRITAVPTEGVDATSDANFWQHSGDALLLPGFIDLHVHGGGGADTMQAANDASALPTITQAHARHGTTSLLATTMTAPREQIEAVLRAIAPACAGPSRGALGARVLGVHLEGPYISPGKLGAQPDFAQTPSAEALLSLTQLAPIRVATIAPELPGAMDAITALVAQGVRVQVGHSTATYEQACEALQQGASGFTHLFNAMSALHHRAPGAAGAALAHAQHAEIIPDLLHVHPGAIRAALRAIPGLYCVTDSTSAATMPDGDYTLGAQRVIKCQGGVRLADGTLAGSTLTMDEALRNLVFRLGLPLHEASMRVSTHAAQYLGLSDRGQFVEGAFADVVVLSADLTVQQVWVEGQRVQAG
jgi:N-acetylglucosamine-6-phosphate deacetylase